MITTNNIILPPPSRARETQRDSSCVPAASNLGQREIIPLYLYAKWVSTSF